MRLQVGLHTVTGCIVRLAVRALTPTLTLTLTLILTLTLTLILTLTITLGPSLPQLQPVPEAPVSSGGRRGALRATARPRLE